MTNKLLVIHPSFKYDTLQLTQPAIAALSQKYAAENIFVLHDDDNDDSWKEYLERSDITHHLYSQLGQVSDYNFLPGVLRNTEELSLAGHTADACHHTAFEEVVGGYSSSHQHSLQVILPTYAISYPELDTGRSVYEKIKELAEQPLIAEKMPTKLEPYHDYLVQRITPWEKASLIILFQYIKSCTRRTDLSVEITIDGREVFRAIRPAAKMIELAIDTVLPLS